MFFLASQYNEATKKKRKTNRKCIFPFLLALVTYLIFTCKVDEKMGCPKNKDVHFMRDSEVGVGVDGTGQGMVSVQLFYFSRTNLQIY